MTLFVFILGIFIGASIGRGQGVDSEYDDFVKWLVDNDYAEYFLNEKNERDWKMK